MKSALALTLFWLATGVGASAWAQSSGVVRVVDQPRHELRGAIEAHLAARREEARREEAFAGRRLTAEERAELREQLRRQWAARALATQTAQATPSAESQPAERIVPGSPMLRTQRH